MKEISGIINWELDDALNNKLYLELKDEIKRGLNFDFELYPVLYYELQIRLINELKDELCILT
jgi:hypothetical protein